MHLLFLLFLTQQPDMRKFDMLQFFRDSYIEDKQEQNYARADIALAKAKYDACMDALLAVRKDVERGTVDVKRSRKLRKACGDLMETAGMKGY